MNICEYIYKKRARLWTALPGAPACAALFTMAACTAAYPAPSPRKIPLSQPPQTGQIDQGDLERIQMLEQQCRVRLQGETANASLQALDRVHEVLGASCDLQTVDHDPLHWMLHCRSDALFESGEFALTSPRQPCPELGNKRVNPWMCVGAVFQRLFALRKGGALERMGLAVVGHVDMQPINPRSDSHLCTGLQERLDFKPSPPWQPVPEDAEEEERQHANNQLAWCRAASVAFQIRQGMEQASAKAARMTDQTADQDGEDDADAEDKTKETNKTNIDDRSDFELAVLGLGTSWLRSQSDGTCPSHGKSWTERTDCDEARRVDILVRFEPRSETAVSTCDRQGDDPATALYCLQHCNELLAVGSHTGSGVGAETAPLFIDGAQAQETLPAGWYLKRAPATAGRVLDLKRVCDTLGVGRP